MTRAFVTCVCAAVMAGCQIEGDPWAAASGDVPRPYVETVPGSTVTFTMRPVWVAEGGARRPLWFAETETTWDAYDVFYLRLDEQAAGADVAAAGREGSDAVTRPTLPYAPADRGWGHGGYPVIGITFHAAHAYCRWLTARTGRVYRLPTQDEFDQAWRGRMNAAARLPPERLFWHAGNSAGRTQPVRTSHPSDDGLYDVVGNVAEWCVADDGEPGVWGGSFLGNAREMAFPDGVQRQSPEWNVNDPSFPRSKWWLRDAPFVGFRVVCEGRPK